MRGNNNNNNNNFSFSLSLHLLHFSYHLKILRVHVDERYQPFRSVSEHSPYSFEQSKYGVNLISLLEPLQLFSSHLCALLRSSTRHSIFKESLSDHTHTPA